MKSSVKTKEIIIKLVCLLYVLLFVYAAISKLLDFENFKVQLGQSPLLSAFALWIVWLIPTLELVISLLLMISKFRWVALLSALGLMTMFTTYIFIVLHFSSFVPCSCGGILEKMSWNAHLLFNIGFMVLALFALFFYHQIHIRKNNHTKFFFAKRTSVIVLGSISSVIVLFLFSEEIVHHENPFVRRYIRRSVLLSHTTDLKFNSYYFSGTGKGQIYLGNYTDPLHILSIDTSFNVKKTIKIDFRNRSVPFRIIRILVKEKYFYLTDGTVPCIYKGLTQDWNIKEELKEVPKFTLIDAIDSTGFVFRNNTGAQSGHIMGIYTPYKNQKTNYRPELLQKQIDGVFDTDGMLQYNNELDKLAYVYFYRNEIVIADKRGLLVSRQHTIDTISRARIKVAYLKNGNRRKMAAPPLIVNSNIATKGNLLFVQSKVPGLYENDAMWKHAAIIDVYNLKKNSYVLSFPIFGSDSDTLQSLFVTHTHLYAIMGTTLMMYELKDILKKEMNRI